MHNNMENNIEENINITEEKSSFVEKLIKEIIQKLEKEKILVIDRFEGNFAVCEDRESGKMHNIEISKLPKDVNEGDVIKFKNNQYSIDKEKNKEIQERINNKIKNLFND